MQTIPEALKARALRILDLSRNRPIEEQMKACAVSARACARAAQLEGDEESFARHMHTAAKFAHLAEMREAVH
jgi:hypothetical protein